jgi:hypothetical protein
MSLNIYSGFGAADIAEPVFEADLDRNLDRPWAEKVVTAAVAAFTVLIVSSVAVLMYFA